MQSTMEKTINRSSSQSLLSDRDFFRGKLILRGVSLMRHIACLEIIITTIPHKIQMECCRDLCNKNYQNEFYHYLITFKEILNTSISQLDLLQKIYMEVILWK